MKLIPIIVPMGKAKKMVSTRQEGAKTRYPDVLAGTRGKAAGAASAMVDMGIPSQFACETTSRSQRSPHSPSLSAMRERSGSFRPSRSALVVI